MSRKKKDSKQWTAAGAARAARDARIATVRWLRTTDLALKLETDKLISAYRIKLRVYENNQAAARLGLFGSLGYTEAQVPRDWPSAAQALAQAQLYVVSPQMCDVVLAAAKTLTLDDLALADEADLPSPTGLIMLPHAVISRAVDGDLSDTRAITWTTPARSFAPSRKQRKIVEYPAARVSVYYDTHGPVRPDNWTEFMHYARAVNTPLPPIIPDAKRCFIFRPDTSENSPEVLRRAVQAGTGTRPGEAGHGGRRGQTDRAGHRRVRARQRDRRPRRHALAEVPLRLLAAV